MDTERFHAVGKLQVVKTCWEFLAKSRLRCLDKQSILSLLPGCFASFENVFFCDSSTRTLNIHRRQLKITNINTVDRHIVLKHRRLSSFIGRRHEVARLLPWGSRVFFPSAFTSSFAQIFVVGD